MNKKTPLQALTLSLIVATLICHAQEVQGLENAPASDQAQLNQRKAETDDWFDDEDTSPDVHLKSSGLDQASDQDLVTDLFKEDAKQAPAQVDVAADSRSLDQATPKPTTAITSTAPQSQKASSSAPAPQSQKPSSASAPHRTENTWQASDFVTKDDTLLGFSKDGLRKLAETPEVILPQRDAHNRPLTKIASFAFTPYKSQEIADYTGREGENGEVSQLDVDGHPIAIVGEDFGPFLIHKIMIPEGYLYIGQDAFNNNSGIVEVDLPDSLTTISDYAFAHMALKKLQLPQSIRKIGDQAFFDNQITGPLHLPKTLKDLGERAFKSNRLTDIIFEGEELTELKEATFQDNDLRQVKLPRSIRHLGPDSFTGNPGEAAYGNSLVLWTTDGQNPHHLHTENVLINPQASANQAQGELDASQWTQADFTYQGHILTGFSQTGLQKIRKNKALVLPSEHQGVKITEIADSAFRNVNFAEKTLQKFDIKSLELPATIKKIGAFAFQSNNLESFEASDDLEEIGQGAFMNNAIESLTLNEKLKVIGDAAFHINRISAIVIPENVETIGLSAFRQNGAKHLLFLGNKISKIGEMAFLSNALDALDLSALLGLEEIGVQTFAHNHLKTIQLPAALTAIHEEAFKNNAIEEVHLPHKVTKIAFNAFDDNKSKAVIIRTAHQNHYRLADGTHFEIDPELMTSDMTTVEQALRRIDQVAFDSLRAATAVHFTNLKQTGQQLLLNKTVRLGYQLKYLYEVDFFLSRVTIDQYLKKAEQAIQQTAQTANLKLLEQHLPKYRLSYNNSALSATQVKRLENELHQLLNLALNQGEISQARMTQGLYLLKTSLPIPEYYIGLNLYTDENGKILFVLDMSHTIGQGQKDDYGNTILNVDEDNEGYHALAIATLADYEGLFIDDILHKDLAQLNISEIKKAPEHRLGIFKAIQDAARDYMKHKAKQSQLAGKNAKQSPSQRIPGTTNNKLSQVVIENSQEKKGMGKAADSQRVFGQQASSVKAGHFASETSLPQTAEQPAAMPIRLLGLALLGFFGFFKLRSSKKE
ncbi:leucine-rich repeat adhesin HupY/LrrG [Streptococcus halichoeri]|uniref:leucine-rich repeat adhesin HupY/LrrG n=1 Tax=Streptococcus halichoeri TaxID=254785 RepID=UPI00135CEFB8|nr:leucine-rich repeat domain-containing protein [Streptococcus halichoeri]